MRKQRNHARLFITTLALASLMSGVALMPIRLASAQTIGGTWAATGSLNVSRNGHTATLLPNGKVLVAGGVNNNLGSGPIIYTTMNSAELYDPVTGAWSYTSNLMNPRELHTATLLRNGQVLVAGGLDVEKYLFSIAYLNSAELFDPATGQWHPTGSLNTITGHPYAALLADGKVLAVGTASPGAPNRIYSAELYDPVTGTWTSTTAPLALGPEFGSLTTLANGKVLGLAGDFDSVKSAELYDPATGTWSSTGSLNVIQIVNTASLLRNGKVLVTGWTGSSPGAELYDPNTGTWRVTGRPSITGTATLLADGRVLFTGDYDAYNSPPPGAGEEVYDPANDTWSQTTSLHNPPRSSYTTTLLSDGRVLAAGGSDYGYDYGEVIFNNAEVYTPTASPGPNQIDDAQVFVRQQYLDFLGREPDTIGFQNWVGTLTGCPNSGFGEFDNPDCDRVHVSAGFYLSEEFRGRGYWAYRFYQTSLGRAPLFAEFLPDMLKVGGPQSPQQEVVNKQTFTDEWVNRPEFKAKYDALTNPMDYVNELLSTTGVTLANRDALVNSLQNKQMTRAQVLREIVESKDVEDKFFIPAFVSMQYFGYLRRDPDTIGYNNWVTTLTNDPGNYRHMIFGFIYSPEYRNRFGQP